MASSRLMVVRRAEALDEQKLVEPKYDLIKEKTLLLKKQVCYEMLHLSRSTWYHILITGLPRSWKNHGILKFSGKVMEFWLKLGRVMVKTSWNFVMRSWKNHRHCAFHRWFLFENRTMWKMPISQQNNLPFFNQRLQLDWCWRALFIVPARNFLGAQCPNWEHYRIFISHLFSNTE